MQDDERVLQQLVEAGDYSSAIAFCNERVHDKNSGKYWLRQLGFVMFLDERNEDSYFGAPKVFDELANRLPLDADAHFWRGYSRIAIWGLDDQSKKTLQKALEIDRDHPYAQLICAGFESGVRRIEALQALLELQPGNLRVWQTLAETLRDAGNKTGSRLAYQGLVRADPYVETNYGILNGWINQVFTGSYWADKYKREAAEQLAIR